MKTLHKIQLISAVLAASFASGSCIGAEVAIPSAPAKQAATPSEMVQEGRDFERLSPAQPRQETSKPEVVEFFGYWCPHCSAFDPALSAWIEKHKEVAVRKIPAAYSASQEPYSKLFYALEGLGKEKELRSQVFKAIHADKNPLNTPELQAEFAAKHGIAKQAYLDMYNSFGVSTKVASAQKSAKAHGLDHVPALVLNGAYITKASPKPLETIEALLADPRVAKAK